MFLTFSVCKNYQTLREEILRDKHKYKYINNLPKYISGDYTRQKKYVNRAGRPMYENSQGVLLVCNDGFKSEGRGLRIKCNSHNVFEIETPCVTDDDYVYTPFCRNYEDLITNINESDSYVATDFPSDISGDFEDNVYVGDDGEAVADVSSAFSLICKSGFETRVGKAHIKCNRNNNFEIINPCVRICVPACSNYESITSSINSNEAYTSNQSFPTEISGDYSTNLYIGSDGAATSKIYFMTALYEYIISNFSCKFYVYVIWVKLIFF